MKFTYGIWAAILAVAILSGSGLFLGLLITGLAAMSSISTGLSVQNKLDGSSPKRQLY